ncbi:probable cinnamyl alcohol dehydrogenase 5 [Elaeis guineensis]|uniref:cinnamyl-alcohol dehydrogenase n=1 Tax=Elaeis guineensis var. tenera TaxID=51953 RepID=A0A6I9SCZ5_ELAGV|nr:probable cinnamyl alcohol dehydrogenase 5 isoform X1 [Elaeis guineensis]
MAADAMEYGVKGSPETEHPRKAVGWAARDHSGVLFPFTFSRRNNGDCDVTIKILFCGICHSDLHSIKNEWKNTMFPIIPGHEIVGIITEVGRNVQKFKVGDKVGVGCMVNSCHSCNSCKQGFENYCPGMILTYNSIDTDGTKTFGGFSDVIVVNEHFVIQFPENLPLDKGAPLLCAGITVYSPMKYFGLNEAGKHLGVVGLGGLGHVAVKFGKALGMKVTVISSSQRKEKEAIERLGADFFVVSSNTEQMKAAMGTMDGIINTVSADHSLMPLLLLLKAQGKMVMVGLPEKPLELPVFPLIGGGKIVAGSCIGGIKDTQEMIDFAGKNNITAEIELIGMDYVNKAMERLVKADVKYRFVIDIVNSLTAA